MTPHGAAADAPVTRYRLDCTEPDEAVERMRAAYTRFDPGPIPDEGFEFSLEGATWGPVDVAVLRHSAPLAGTCEPPERLVATAGDDAASTSRVSYGREDVRGAVLLAPSVPYAMESPGPLHTTTVALDRAEVARVGAERSGLDPGVVRFHAVAPRTALLGSYWAGLVGHLRRDLLVHDGLTTEPLLRAQVLRQLATALLVVFANTTHTLDPPGGRDTAEPATVRRAMAFVDAHAHEPLTVSDIAAAAGLGTRGLQHAVLRHCGVTPLGYLRRVRLHRAHAELVAADPVRGDTVVAIAARWGFVNPGRFAGAYREVFGRSPSVTLRA